MRSTISDYGCRFAQFYSGRRVLRRQSTNTQYTNQKMEESLGVQIFECSNKKVVPTEIGETIIAAARRIQHEVKTIKELAATAQDPLAGSIRLGAIPTVSTYIFPTLVPVVKQQLPKIRLILLEEKTDQLIQLLISGRIDAALLALPSDEEALQSECLFTDVVKLAVAPDHPLAKKPPPTKRIRINNKSCY